MTSFPGSIVALARPTSTTAMNASGYEGDVIIDAISDEIEALEAKVGVDNSVVSTSLDFRVSVFEDAKVQFGPSPVINGFWAWTNDPYTTAATVRTPAAAKVFLNKLMVPTTQTISTLTVEVSNAGNNYANVQVGVYSSAGSLLGYSAEYNSAGSLGGSLFSSTGTKQITGLTETSGGALTITGGSTTFVWLAIHMGVNSATTVSFYGSSGVAALMNCGLATAVARIGSVAGGVGSLLQTNCGGSVIPSAIDGATVTGAIWFGVS